MGKRVAFFWIMLFMLNLNSSILASSNANYQFKRLWPVLQQPWTFHSPCGIAMDSSNNVYVVNMANQTLNQYTGSGKFITSWPIDTNQSAAPYDIAIDLDGYIYITDMYDNYVKKFTHSGDFITEWGGFGNENGQMDRPHGIAVDRFGHVYVADYNNHRIQKFSGDGLFLRSFGQMGIMPGEFNNPLGIEIDDNNRMFVCDYANHRIQSFELTKEDIVPIAQWGRYGSSNAEFNGPNSIRVQGSYVYVTDENNHRIQKFTDDGQFLAAWGNFGIEDAQLREPSGILVHNDILYIADTRNDRIQLFSTDGKFITRWGRSGDQFYEFHGVAVDTEGNIFATDQISHCVRKFDPNGKSLIKWGGYGSNPGQLYNPTGIDIHMDAVFVADNNHRIQRFSLDGRFLDAWGEFGSTPGKFHQPQGIAVDPDGYLYVADTMNHRIQKFDPQGAFVLEWGQYGNDDGQFILPSGVAVDASGHVFVVDQNNNRIQKFDYSGNYLFQWGSEGIENGRFSSPCEIELDREGNVFVAEFANGRIQKFSPSGVFISKFGGSGSNPGELARPKGLAIQNNGNVVVADTRNNRIQVFKNSNIPLYKAIIVAGGGPYAGNNLWESTQMCANFAYRAMIYQGLNKNTIQYLSADNDLDLDSNGVMDDIDGPATISALQDAILSWANGANHLVLFLIDHGGDALFRLNEQDLLAANQLDDWLDEIQIKTGIQVILIYDACKSGSFVSHLLPPPNEERVVITSSQPNENAYFVSQGAISFSVFFWTQVFNGSSIWDAFSIAADAMSYPVKYQTAMLDDNSNGIANETGDGHLARNLFIGNGVQISADAPTIDSVSEDQVIESDNQAKIQAWAHDPDGIASVWAIIRPPNYQPNPYDHPIQDLPSIEMIYTAGVYEAIYSDFHTEGVYQIAIYAMDRAGNTCSPKMTTVTVSQPLSDRAVLIAGASNDHTSRLSIDRNVRLAYDALVFQGYSSKDIIWLGASENDQTDTPATKENLRNAIAETQNHTKDFLLYFVGDGTTDTFHINNQEEVFATEIDQWLDNAKSNIQGQVTLIFDADCSGSFIASLTENEMSPRIVITSTGKSGTANNGASGALSFSSFFWQRVFSGDTTRNAFIRSINAISCTFPGQLPMLDDNGNGVPNESGIDGKLAENHRLGCGIMMADDMPIIGSVSQSSNLTESQTYELFVENISSTSEISKVWAVINKPVMAYKQLSHLTVPADIISLTLSNGRYSCSWDGFSQYGSYPIAFFAEDVLNNVSLPVQAQVFQKSYTDVYEPDNLSDQARIIVSDNQYPQYRNFHHTDDIDWITFFGIKDVTYSIEVFASEKSCDPVIEIYAADAETLIRGPWNWGGAGNNEFLSWQCPEDGIYYLKLYNHLDATGQNTGYALKIYRPMGVFPGFISGLIKDKNTKKPIPAVTLRILNGTGSGMSDRDGIYVIVDEEGIYTLDARGTGYEAFSKNVRIYPLDETPLNIHLVPSDQDGDGIPDQIEINTGTDPKNPDSDGDGLLDGIEDSNRNGIWEEGIELNPRDPDTDNDEISDGYEADQELNYFFNDAYEDKDQDGYCNLTEFENKTNANSPDPPGMTGYNYETDSKIYPISGKIRYQGCETGKVFVEVFDTPDANFTEIKHAAMFSGYDRSVSVRNGDYMRVYTYELDVEARNVHYVRTFIDTDNNEEFDSLEPFAFYALPITSTSRIRNVTLVTHNDWHFSMSIIDDSGLPVSDVSILKMQKDDECIGYTSSKTIFNNQAFQMKGEYFYDTIFTQSQLAQKKSEGKGVSIDIGIVGRQDMKEYNAPFSFVVNPEEIDTPDLTGFWSFTFSYEGHRWEDDTLNGQQTCMINFLAEQTDHAYTGIIDNSNQRVRMIVNGNTIKWYLEQKEGDRIQYQAEGSGTLAYFENENNLKNTIAMNRVMGSFAGKSFTDDEPNGMNLGHFFARFTPKPRGQLTVGSPSPIVYSNARFSIPLMMDTGTSPLGTYSTTISFNKDILELARIKNKIPGIETHSLEDINTTGMITIGDNNNEARANGPAGVIYLADFEFWVTGSPGASSSLEIDDNTTVLDTFSNEIPISKVGGLLSVGPAIVNAGKVAPMTIFYDSTVEIPITILQAFHQYIGHYHMELQYDSMLFDAIAVKKGESHLNKGNIDFNIDKTSGTIEIEGYWDQTEAPISYAETARVILRSESIDDNEPLSTIKLKVHDLRNTDGQSISHYVQDAQLDVTVGLCGDVNQDESVDMADSILLSNYLVGDVGPNDLCLAVADTNDNGRIDIGDSMFIVQYILNQRNCICKDTEQQACR